MSRRRLVLLALATVTGTLDVTSFVRLGGVFPSVMTGNLILLGVATARRDATLAIHSAVALAGFVVGVTAGERLGGDPDDQGNLPAPRLRTALGTETAVLAIVSTLWVLASGRPAPTDQLVILVLMALAMGLQSALTRHLAKSGVSTTYLTGTLTGAVGSLLGQGKPRQVEPTAVIVIAGVIAGAMVAGAGDLAFPRVVPWLAVVALSAVTVGVVPHRTRVTSGHADDAVATPGPPQ